jgi:sortase B
VRASLAGATLSTATTQNNATTAATWNNTYSATAAPVAPRDIDWTSLTAANGEVAGWLVVEGTTISLPVVAEKSSCPTWWLSHDLWGNVNSMGWPYLDARCATSTSSATSATTADGSVSSTHNGATTSSNTTLRVVYGHHLWEQSYGFSPLTQLTTASALAATAGTRWITSSSTTYYQPLCALNVPATYEPLCNLPAAPTSAWLQRLASDAHTTSSQVNTLIANARDVLILITCNSLMPGAPRCAVVYIAL